MRSSKLREAMETISLEFTKSNLGFPLILDKNIRPEKYEEAFQDFIIQVLGAKSGSTSR
jgi:3-methyladenine DNA glycosylase Tag